MKPFPELQLEIRQSLEDRKVRLGEKYLNKLSEFLTEHVFRYEQIVDANPNVVYPPQLEVDITELYNEVLRESATVQEVFNNGMKLNHYKLEKREFIITQSSVELRKPTYWLRLR